MAAVPDRAGKRAAFRKLHESGCFLIPNPWDIGSCCFLRHLGFKAVATTSSGFAFSRGLPDEGALTRDLALGHVREIVIAADLPVNADFQAGYSHTPEGVAENVRLCVETGVAGLSIEDATGDERKPLYELPLAVERIQAARAAIDAWGPGVLLTARAECHLVGHPEPLKESVRRLQAYAEAGADVLFAPGPRGRDEIQAIVAAAAPKPVNVLVSSNTGLRLSDLAELGVRRVSVGSALARTAWAGFLRAARAMAETGSFACLEGSVSFEELDRFFREDVKTRRGP
jgi:2-methylisocitrate lyase-like PEP mutase family enzyme